MQSAKEKFWLRAARLIFGLPGLTALVPITLLGAHYARGAETDDPYITTLYALVLMIIGLATLVLSKFRAATPGFAIATIGLLIWVLLGLSGNWYRARSEVLTLAAAGAVFLTGRTAGQSSNSLNFVWHTLIWSLMLLAILALVGHISNYTGDPMGGDIYETTRLRASFVSPNTAATLLALSALVAMGQLLYTVRHASPNVQTRNDLIDHIFRRAFPAITLFVLATSCLWLTSSRAGLATFAVALIALVGAEYRSYRRGRRRTRKSYKRMRWAVFIGAILIAAFVLYSEVLSNRAIEAASDVRSRLDLYGIYWDVWQQKPWFGHGLGSFNRVNDSLMTLDNVATIGLMGAAHNVVLQWLIQQGIIGTTLISLLIISVHIPIIRALRATGARSRTFLRFALCASGLVILHSMVDYALEIPSIMWTYTLLLGLAHGRSTALLSIEKDAMEETKVEIADADIAVA